jgi:ABC-type Fe3+/spermidine/putrescine transport system ATPase subunit
MRFRNVENIVSLIKCYLNGQSEIISISGPSASGKTTLALQIISNLIDPEEQEKTIWVQASEHFPKRRLDALLLGNSSQKKYVLQNTFIFPSNHVLSSFEEQQEILKSLTTQLYPPGTKYFVIDNISNHLRLSISLKRDLSQCSKLVNQFFNEVLFPLIMRCKREKIHLIMIHEVSQDPHSGENHRYYNKLFERIESLSFSFQGLIRFRTQLLRITPRKNLNNSYRLFYELRDEGVFTCPL